MPQCLIPSRPRWLGKHGLPVGTVNDLHDLVSSHTQPTLSLKPATIIYDAFDLV